MPDDPDRRRIWKRSRTSYRLSQKKYRYTVLICAGAGCISCDCVQVRNALVEELFKAGLTDEIQIKMTGCMGNCDVGPAMIVKPGGIFYCKLKPEDMADDRPAASGRRRGGRAILLCRPPDRQTDPASG